MRSTLRPSATRRVSAAIAFAATVHGAVCIGSQFPTAVPTRTLSRYTKTSLMPVESLAATSAERRPRCHDPVLILPPARATDGGVGSLTKTRMLLMAPWISDAVHIEQLDWAH